MLGVPAWPGAACTRADLAQPQSSKMILLTMGETAVAQKWASNGDAVVVPWMAKVAIWRLT